MSLVAPVPKIELDAFPRPAANTSRAWVEISQEDLAHWDDCLLASGAWLYQYSFWNEPLRVMGLTPRYLAWGSPGQPLAYVCILTAGFRPARIGLVFRGPTSLEAGADVPEDAVTDLMEWARAQGYMFIRFTHSDARILNPIASRDCAREIDAFPYFQDFPIQSPDFVVAQCDGEDETLAGFDREVRRKLKRAVELGFEFCSDDSPQSLADQWHLYQDCARRKGFRLERPLSIYREILRRARRHNCARVYSVKLRDEVVGSCFVIRDSASAHCLLAAFAPEHRHAAVFLHWKAMRDMYGMGTRNYNFGPGPGSLARFKQQFAARGPACPAPVTIVLNDKLFKLWWKALFPLAILVKPAIVGTFRRLCLISGPTKLRIQSRKVRMKVRSRLLRWTTA